MTLERTNEIGNIRLDDYIFAQIVKTGLTKGRGRAFHASEKGKLLGSQGINTGIGEITSNIKIKETTLAWLETRTLRLTAECTAICATEAFFLYFFFFCVCVCWYLVLKICFVCFLL